MGLRLPSPFGWRTLVRCPTAVFPLSLLSVGGRKAIAVEQKPWRRCLLPSVEPRRGGGDFPQTEVCSQTESWAVAPSARKESPWRPCPGWWSVKCWTDRWPARGPNAAGESRLCPHTRGPLAAKGRTVAGERQRVPPTARPRINEDELVLHAKPRGVAVTVLSEESTFEAGRNAFAVWPRLVAVKRLSSFWP